MLTTVRRISLTFSLFVVVILVMALNVQATGPGGPRKYVDDATVAIENSDVQQDVIRGMWTHEERLAAKPLSMPTLSMGDLSAAGEQSTPSGAPGLVPGTKANPQANVAAQGEYPEEWDMLLSDFSGEQGSTSSDSGAEQGSVSVQGTSGIYTVYRANYYAEMHQRYPYSAVGKLYFQDSSGNRYSCTASVISPNNIIVTAAHCVYNTDNNTWYTNFSFVPAERAGVAPYGTFPWSRARVLNNWINAASSGSAWRYDVAVISLGNNSSGRAVTYYTGSLGRSWNFSYAQNHHAFGYAANLDNGSYSYVCTSESFQYSTDVLGMGCNMQQGSSGGPWIRVFAPYVVGSINYVNATVSGGISGSTYGNTFYGPRFSDGNFKPLCDAEGC